MSIQVTKAAAYCRVSTDSDEQETSYEAQFTHYTNFIRSHDGWELAGIFANDGLSDTKAKTRPQFNALIAACESGSVNLVITKSISRFARNTLDALKYIYETRNASANGHETLDTDASAEAAKAEDLACERYVLAKGKLQIEVLRNLDKVAPAGAVLFAAWPRIEGATGLPARVWAITE